MQRSKQERFESHLYGIETMVYLVLLLAMLLFESHLYGIETAET